MITLPFQRDNTYVLRNKMIYKKKSSFRLNCDRITTPLLTMPAWGNSPKTTGGFLPLGLPFSFPN